MKKQAAGATYDVVEAATRASERSIDAELVRLKRGLGILATVGSTAPFVGLFGTTFGIINAFQAMGGGAGRAADGANGLMSGSGSVIAAGSAETRIVRVATGPTLPALSTAAILSETAAPAGR